MNKELNELLKYCEDNNIKVVFTDSKVLADYGAMNPEAAKAMGFPDIDNDTKTKEIEIDKTLPEETQTQNLKHELIEMALMQGGMEYWQAHTIALKGEAAPFKDWQKFQVRAVNLPSNKPEKRSWWRRKRKVDNSSVSSVRR
jgi:hypothetical protein